MFLPETAQNSTKMTVTDCHGLFSDALSSFKSRQQAAVPISLLAESDLGDISKTSSKQQSPEGDKYAVNAVRFIAGETGSPLRFGSRGARNHYSERSDCEWKWYRYKQRFLLFTV